jgi:hypothetical protein
MGSAFFFLLVFHLIVGLNEKSCYSVKEQQTQAIR